MIQTLYINVHFIIFISSFLFFSLNFEILITFGFDFLILMEGDLSRFRKGNEVIIPNVDLESEDI